MSINYIKRQIIITSISCRSFVYYYLAILAYYVALLLSAASARYVNVSPLRDCARRHTHTHTHATSTDSDYPQLAIAAATALLLSDNQ
jgi:hypothetical protein